MALQAGLVKMMAGIVLQVCLQQRKEWLMNINYHYDNLVIQVRLIMRAEQMEATRDIQELAGQILHTDAQIQLCINSVI